MATYPYISGQAALAAAFAQLRKGGWSKVDAGYLQRFNIAPANESYVISILRFLGIVDDEGNRVADNTQFFYGNDEAFKEGLDATLRRAYAQLFDEMGDGAFEAEKQDLTHWFRAADRTSDLVGQRQASTFQTLSAIAGHGDVPVARTATAKKAASGTNGSAKKATAKKASAKQTEKPVGGDGDGVKLKAQGVQDVGLTVRIEVNLPPGGDADTYDAIFASIKKHLMS
ncbi:DUF5343 domain-containing protein [Nocardioides marmoribigeumensis]|uniref:DUF5343 domain-containing protein n=1 Tax=Nocardioides marmoribigeumensis TaxID=433649 RepID=A0ABU2C059_9ACTN|nr:DUF5343 domain-containing protein [Nocardioides marmoribigeumensis]MDR7364057.1 hypothetical protein [Nocardioides marmoribigeumensis]